MMSVTPKFWLFVGVGALVVAIWGLWSTPPEAPKETVSPSNASPKARSRPRSDSALAPKQAVTAQPSPPKRRVGRSRGERRLKIERPQGGTASDERRQRGTGNARRAVRTSRPTDNQQGSQRAERDPRTLRDGEQPSRPDLRADSGMRRTPPVQEALAPEPDEVPLFPDNGDRLDGDGRATPPPIVSEGEVVPLDHLDPPDSDWEDGDELIPPPMPEDSDEFFYPPETELD